MGKFYWLKLQKDFFKKHKLIILRSMEHGMTYEAIFIHLMTESIDHDAMLRFSDSKPYTPKTLSPIIGTDEKTMADALKIFQDLELIEIFEDGTIFVPLASDNIGSAEDNANANRQRRFRERNASITPSVTKNNASITPSVTKDNESIEIRDKSIENRDKSIIREKEKEREKQADDKSSATLSESKSRFCPPTVEEVAAYCEERKNGIDPQRFCDFYSAKNWMIGKTKMKDWKACVRTWEARSKQEFMDHEYTAEQMEKMKTGTLGELKALLRKPQDKLMENDYDFSQEATKKREEQDQKLLDDLLNE